MPEQLCAYCSYRDAPAALRWLAAVGFTEVRRQDGAAGEVVHAEVRLGDAVVMVASADAGYERPPLLGRSTGNGLYLVVDDVDDWFDRAVAAGARPVFPPEDTGFGTRRARVLDPEGGEWSGGSYRPGLEGW